MATTFSHLLTDAVSQHMTHARTSSTQMRDTGRRNVPIAVRTSTMRILPSFPGYTFSTMPFGQQLRANCGSAMTTTSLTLIGSAALNHLVRRVSVGRYSRTQRCQNISIMAWEIRHCFLRHFSSNFPGATARWLRPSRK